MTPQNLNAQDLKAAILARHGSVHNFCRRHAGEGAGQLKRSTVYMVLAGRYPGKAAPQLAKIRAALEGREESSLAPALALPSPEALATALQSIRCKHCRTLDKSRCGGCRAQTLKEAQELHTHLAGEA